MYTRQVITDEIQTYACNIVASVITFLHYFAFKNIKGYSKSVCKKIERETPWKECNVYEDLYTLVFMRFGL